MGAEYGFIVAKQGNSLLAKEVRQAKSGGWHDTGNVYSRQIASRFGKEKMRGVAEKLRNAGLRQVG